MATNADLITADADGNVDILALVRAQAAEKAARPVQVPAHRTTRYTQPIGSGMRIGDTWERTSSFDGRTSTATFLGMDGDLAVFTGIDL